MKDDIKAVLVLVCFFLFLIGAIVLGWSLALRNYRECRAHGFSRLYCWSQEHR